MNSGPHPSPLPTATAVGSPWGMRVRTALQAPTWRQRPRRTLAFSLIHDCHNGTIAFRSEPGAGTTFSVRIPVRPPGAEPAEDATTV